MAHETAVLVDVGSTYTKAVRVNAVGVVEASAQAPTLTADLDLGFRQVTDMVLTGPSGSAEAAASRVIASSSAAGGLRLFVVGLETSLTVEAGKRAAMSAGARVVGSVCAADLQTARTEDVIAARADIVLLTGGSNGGDRSAIIAGAKVLNRIAPGLPLVIAGNEDAYDELQPLVSNRPVARFLPNVMPAIGELRPGPVQDAVREIFSEHVMGAGRFRSGSVLARALRMPTPAAVLAGASVLARLGAVHSWLTRPVVVDVGGATTDVHSVLEDVASRSVEGDLGLRENADSVVTTAYQAGLIAAGDTELQEAAQLRRAQRDYLPANTMQALADLRLAELACTVALERHAGVLSYQLRPTGGVLRATGRDLRGASCFIGTGGIFAHAAGGRRVLRSALAAARVRGALVPKSPLVISDKRYLIWAIGLLESQSADAGMSLARTWAADRQAGATEVIAQ